MQHPQLKLANLMTRHQHNVVQPAEGIRSAKTIDLLFFKRMKTRLVSFLFFSFSGLLPIKPAFLWGHSHSYISICLSFTFLYFIYLFIFSFQLQCLLALSGSYPHWVGRHLLGTHSVRMIPLVALSVYGSSVPLQCGWVVITCLCLGGG